MADRNTKSDSFLFVKISFSTCYIVGLFVRFVLFLLYVNYNAKKKTKKTAFTVIAIITR